MAVRLALQYLLLLLTFVRAAHYWTETHPEIAFEDDIDKLLATHEVLADCILNDPESRDSISQSLLDELPVLRLKADKAIGLLAAIVDSSDDAIVSKTLEGIITSWNAGAERLFGYTSSEAVGQHISLIIPVNRRDEERVIIERIKQGERIEHFDTARIRKDKTLFDVSLTISPVRDASGKIVGASKIARDITERKRIERELRESEERYRTLADALDTQVQFRTQELERSNTALRDLSGRLLESQDDERRHIARELHDSAGQTLAALGMQLARINEDAKKNPAQLAKGIEDAKGLVQHLSQEIRTTSYLLHPPLLDGEVDRWVTTAQGFLKCSKVRHGPSSQTRIISGWSICTTKSVERETMDGNEMNAYSACEMTEEEEKKIKSSLKRFRTEAAPVFERFRAGSIELAEMREALRRLDARTNEEVKSVLGEQRHQKFIENITKDARPHLPQED